MRLRLNPLNRLLLLRHKALRAEKYNLELLDRLDKKLVKAIVDAKNDGETSFKVSSARITPRMREKLTSNGFTLSRVENSYFDDTLIDWGPTCQSINQIAG